MSLNTESVVFQGSISRCFLLDNFIIFIEELVQGLRNGATYNITYKGVYVYILSVYSINSYKVFVSSYHLLQIFVVDIKEDFFLTT